jgi:large repetitive protein
MKLGFGIRARSVYFVQAAIAMGAASCSATDSGLAPPSASPTGLGSVVVQVAHREGARPTFVWLSQTGMERFADATIAAREVLTSVAPAYKLDPGALAAVTDLVVHDSGKGAIVVRVKQRVGRREVFRSEASALFTRALEPVAFSGALAASMEGSETLAILRAEDALSLAHHALTGRAPRETAKVSAVTASDEYIYFASSEYERAARVKEVLFPNSDGVEAAFRVELFLRDSARSAHSFVVSALDGRILFTNDLVRYEQATYRAWADPTTLMPMDGPQGNAFVPLVSAKPDGTRITPVPAPLVTLQNFPFSKNDPWLPVGASTTSGNNINSYADLQAPDGYAANTQDLLGDVSAPGVFDWSADLLRSPSSSQAAIRSAVTHQFYVTNFMHDWFYDAGFDEKSRNPQQSNFGRGGSGGDAIDIEAQDYSGRNNANASTPADGASPRIQMYIFSGRTSAGLTVNSPAALAGAKAVAVGSFGSDAFDVSGSVVLANDGAGGDPKDACEALRGSFAGKLILVHRGTCSFIDKARNLQAAGAAGMILTNVPTSVSPSTPPFMGGSGSANDVSIPCLSIALSDGQALEAAIAAGGAEVTMKRDLGADLDGALDTGVVAHEWGHVLSNRLIGDGDGLNTNQAGGLGEGWSDFVALLLMAREEDLQSPKGANWSGVYPAGSYAMAGSPADPYFGIRRVPYSADFSKNALTFKHISEGTPLPATTPISYGEDGNGNAEVHATGEVWASMLWECYVAMLRDKRLTFLEAQERMKRYLVAGMKLTPVSPTLLEARDALLAAAYAGDSKDYELFWQAFARRGAGIGAKGPDKATADNAGVKESFASGNAIEIVSAKLTDNLITCDRDGILDAGEVGIVELTVRNAGVGTLSAATAMLSPRSGGASTLEDKGTAFPSLKPFETAKTKLRVRVDGTRAPLALDVVVSDPSLAEPVTLSLAERRNADEAADSSAIDRVDTVGTSWTVTRTDKTKTTKKWSIVSEGAARYWSVPNGTEPSDHRLISAPFSVPSGAFGLSFKHRFGFESSAERKKDFDGGVVEVSIDAGKTWKDANDYGAKVNYNVTLDNDPQGTNPLKGRKAFGNRSAGYPAWITTDVRINIGASAEAVQIRFRAGADDNAVDKSWDLDDISLTDVGTTPFWSLGEHADACDEAGPRVVAAGPTKVTVADAVVLTGTGTHPTGLLISYRWEQESGPSALLSQQDTSELKFSAPQLAQGEEQATMVFALRGNDGALVSPASRISIQVSAKRTQLSASGGCSTSPNPSERSGLIVALGLSALLLVLRMRMRTSGERV